jgi:predicted house-cleaning noncanonical NTP pyrophosphatase (MazG superfamily)
MEGETWIGCGMTYTLFECLKEKLVELVPELEEDFKASKLASVSEYVNKIQIAPVIKTSEDQKDQPQKKEQLTKAQKRRMWERTDNKGNRPRGYDWVDIIRHLSQTGGKEEVSTTNAVTNITQQPSLMSHPLN